MVKEEVKVKGMEAPNMVGMEFRDSSLLGSDPQAPPSMGFSRQEYWSGVLFLNAACTSGSSLHKLPKPNLKDFSIILLAYEMIAVAQ